MATDGPFKKMEGELTKPYVLCRIGENDEIIERLGELHKIDKAWTKLRAALDKIRRK